jgi:hypothetical protein
MRGEDRREGKEKKGKERKGKWWNEDGRGEERIGW